MSSACFASLYHSETCDYDDDELEGWYEKLNQEVNEYFIMLKDFRVRTKNALQYSLLLEDLESSFKPVSIELPRIVQEDNKSTLNIQEIPEIAAKLRRFDASLIDMQKFVRKETYDASKLEYIFLKIKGFFNAIINCLLHRRLRATRTIYGDNFAATFSGPKYFATPRSSVLNKPDTIRFFSQQVNENLHKLPEDKRYRTSVGIEAEALYLSTGDPSTHNRSSEFLIPAASNEESLPRENENKDQMRAR